MSGDRAAFEEVHGASEIAFFERTLENMRGRGANAYDNERLDPAPADVPTSDRWNRRDALMAGNLRWLMEPSPCYGRGPMGGFTPPSAMNWVMRCSRTGSGTEPSARMASWKYRWSNLAPSFASASRRWRRICSSPSL